MGLFGKKERKVEPMPEVPVLPRLPDLPDMNGYSDMPIHQLPSFPNSSMGAKFSRDTIKDAVSGEGRGEFYADDFSGDDMRMMQEPLRRPLTEEMKEDMEEEMAGLPEIPRRPIASGFRAETEPVFIRIDRFEEGLKLFETVKDQISAIEKNLAETKRIKEREEAELQAWEAELKRMKDEMEKISSNIFSKV